MTIRNHDGGRAFVAGRGGIRYRSNSSVKKVQVRLVDLFSKVWTSQLRSTSRWFCVVYNNQVNISCEAVLRVG